ncbi:MAG: sulfotransferase [Planctomycetes bacterium]|nr:sulfotransferase [Planctomycetota bacterium]
MLHFLGIGAQKSGTSWLYEVLRQHPEVRFPGVKEVHFWDQQRHLGLDWYRGLFAGDDPRRAGEITPAYAILPAAVIAEVHAAFPDVRLIYLIRNPIQRAWSSAKMAVGRAEMRVDEASDRWFCDHFRSAGSLARGDYETCLRSWLAHYPASQLLVLRYEAIAADPEGVAAACCDHLGIARFAVPPAELRQRVFGGAPERLRESLWPELLSIYGARIESLARFLGIDLREWLDPPGSV